MSEMFSLHDRVCVITGGAGILGTAMSSAPLAHGARIAIVDRDAARTARFTASVTDAQRARGYVADIRSRDRWKK